MIKEIPKIKPFKTYEISSCQAYVRPGPEGHPVVIDINKFSNNIKVKDTYIGDSKLDDLQKVTPSQSSGSN